MSRLMSALHGRRRSAGSRGPEQGWPSVRAVLGSFSGRSNEQPQRRRSRRSRRIRCQTRHSWGTRPDPLWAAGRRGGGGATPREAATARSRLHQVSFFTSPWGAITFARDCCALRRRRSRGIRLVLGPLYAFLKPFTDRPGPDDVAQLLRAEDQHDAISTIIQWQMLIEAICVLLDMRMRFSRAQHVPERGRTADDVTCR